MLEFGKLQIVDKTFTRESGIARGQAYDGLKFRRANSGKGGEQSIDEKFTISNKAFEKLDLANFALVQANTEDGVLILVVEDTDGIAKFMRQSTKKDGTKQQKGKSFFNEFLLTDLTKAGVIKEEVFGNQYLALTDVTSTIEGVPAYVKSIHLVSVDTTVDASKDSEDDVVAATASVEKDF